MMIMSLRAVEGDLERGPLSLSRRRVLFINMARRRISKPKRAYLRDWENGPDGIEISVGRRGGRYFEYRKGDHQEWFQRRPLLVKAHGSIIVSDGQLEAFQGASYRVGMTQKEGLADVEFAVRESERVLKEVMGQTS